MIKKPRIYIIAGCNGAGKTTASYTILPDLLNCKEFVNADEIARGISPFDPESVAFEAGRIMLNRINDLILKKESFAFETTLSTKSFINYIRRARNDGYEAVLLFIYLDSIPLAIERVKTRVIEGGHNIPADVITRRYKRGLENFFTRYIPIADRWLLINNSGGGYEQIAYNENRETIIINPQLWHKIKSNYGK